MDPVDLRLAAVARRIGREHDLYDAAGHGRIVRVHSGAYVDAGRWRDSRVEDRLRVRAHGVASRAHRIIPVFSHLSAAAIRGWPLRDAGPERSHVTVPLDSGRRSRGGVIRYADDLGRDDVETVDGLLVTSAARTVFDVARTASAECAVVVADGALRQAALGDGREFDEDAQERLRADVRARVAEGGGTRGIRQARFVAEFADGRAQLPGESISRLWMATAGFPAPLLQLRIPFDGVVAYLDFAWPELGLFGEFDGDGKYVDPELMGGRTTGQVLRDQRMRETAIVAATGWRCIRWGWEHLRTPHSFAAFLRAHGLPS